MNSISIEEKEIIRLELELININGKISDLKK